MRKVHVLLLSAFLLGAVVLPVFDSSVGPGRLQPEAVQAQGQVAAAIVGVCVDPVGAVVCVAWLTLAFTAYVYSGGTVPSGQDLIDTVANLFDVFSDNGPGVQQFRAQYLNHPNYTWLNADILSEIALALAGLEAVGWAYVADWHGTAHPGWELATWAGGTLEMMTDEFVMPIVSGCTVGEQGPSHRLWGPSGAETWQVGFLESGTEIYTDIQSVPSYNSSYQAFNMNGQGMTHGDVVCGLCGRTGRLVVTMPGSGTFSGGEYESLSNDVFGLNFLGEVYPWPSITWYFSEFATVEAWTLEGLEGERYNTPLSPDFLDTWDGVSDVPLLSGVNGAVIGATAVPVPDDTSWWEGLFGGLGGKLTGIGDVLQNIWDAIQSIGDTLADVAADVQALPQTLVEAATAAVVPNTATLESDWSDTADLMGSRAPFSWLVAIYAVLPNLFTGGSGCVQMDMGAESVGWPAVVLNMCIPEGAATVTKAISRVVAVMLMLFYTINTARQVMNWGRDA